MTTGLELINVSKSFGGVHAVVDLNLKIPAGQITGLIGPNGAGKTTVINMISGINTVTGGQILKDGRSLHNEYPDAVSNAGVARTFQNLRLFTELSALDNGAVAFSARQNFSVLQKLLGTPAARSAERDNRASALSLFERFGISDLVDRRVDTLSYGHQRRVEIVRALALNPDVLLLDEPVAGMNTTEAQDLGELVRELRNEGKAVLLVEHNVEFVMSLCDEVYVLDHGELISNGTPAQVREDRRVITAYLGDRHA